MRDWVNGYKARHSLSSADEALRHMRAALGGGGAAAAAAAASVEEAGDADAGEKKGQLRQLICWSDFEKHDEILTYLMGLGRSERGWLIGKLQKKVRVFRPFQSCNGQRLVAPLIAV
jgi:hypothetical protein